MRVCLTKFTDEIADFLTNETLKAIDYGILDLHHIKNRELRNVFYFLEELLTVELELNYLENETGIFRVCRRGNFWYYKIDIRLTNPGFLIFQDSTWIFYIIVIKS